MIGTTVGSYCITELVSVGGMGTVYKAEHTLIGKTAAVKVLHPELRSNRDVVQRFFNEAKATTQIKHPGIVEMFDFGYLPSGDGYIVMEFLEGQSLATRLEQAGTVAEGEAAMLMRGVCSALHAAHVKGIVHRDLKPDNIFLCPDPDAPTGERTKVLDFGIAKLNTGLTGPQNATKTGAVMGTPTYMSPEQCKGGSAVDLRSDLYSIGCVFYELVAGRPPFTDMSTGELIGAHLFIDPPTPSSVGARISKEAEALIMQLLQKQPDKRVQSALELAQRFAAIANGAGLVARATPMPTVDYRPTKPDDAQTASPTPSKRFSPEASAATLASDSDISAVKPVKTVSPTTLSGAASQSAMRSAIRPPRSKVGILVGVAAAGLVGGFAVVMALAGGSKKPAAAPMEEPTKVEKAEAPTPAPAPAPPPPSEPATVAPPPTPAPPLPPPPTPAQPLPPPPSPPPTETVVAAPPSKPLTPTPTPTPTKKKPKAKTATPPPDKTGKGSGSGSGSKKILIETDI